MVDLNSLQKRLRSLRKTLKGFQENPKPGAVHRLRSQTRKAEAAVRASGLDQKRNGHRLLKLLKSIGKAAGKVRDIDVLVGFASRLPTGADPECLVALLEFLGSSRAHPVGNLRNILAKKQKEIRRRLRRCSRIIEKHLSPSGSRIAGNIQMSSNATAFSLQLESELRAWPELSKGNLHSYRLKVKALRYTLQLDPESDSGFIQALGEVKDQIGRWHDWDILSTVADKVLDHKSPCKITAQIRHQVHDHLAKALSAAKVVSRHYSVSHAPHKNGRAHPSTPHPELK